MKIIVCKINMGALTHKIYIGDESQKPIQAQSFSLSLEEIPTFIVSYKDIKNIYISGAPKDFTKKIELETKELENKIFSQNTKIFHYI